MREERKLKLIQFVSKILTGKKSIKEKDWKTLRGRIRSYLNKKELPLLAKISNYNSIRF